VALNRPTLASSVYVNSDPNDVGPFLTSNAVDGNRDPDATKPENSCFGTTNEANPWWAVDLGAALSVLGVLLTNRGDCCGNTLSFSFVFYHPTLRDQGHVTHFKFWGPNDISGPAKARVVKFRPHAGRLYHILAYG